MGAALSSGNDNGSDGSTPPLRSSSESDGPAAPQQQETESEGTEEDDVSFSGNWFEQILTTADGTTRGFNEPTAECKKLVKERPSTIKIHTYPDEAVVRAMLKVAQTLLNYLMTCEALAILSR